MIFIPRAPTLSAKARALRCPRCGKRFKSKFEQELHEKDKRLCPVKEKSR